MMRHCSLRSIPRSPPSLTHASRPYAPHPICRPPLPLRFMSSTSSSSPTSSKPTRVATPQTPEQRARRSRNEIMRKKLHSNPSKTLATFDEALANNQIVPDPPTWESAIVAAGEAGRVDKALEYYDRFRMQTLPGESKFPCWSLISVLVTHGRALKAEAIYHEMADELRKEGKKPHLSAAAKVVSALARMGKVDQALAIVTSYSSPPVIDLYNALFTGLRDAKLGSVANDLYAKMPIPPSERTLGVLLSLNEHDYSQARRFWNAYLSLKIPPSSPSATFMHYHMLNSAFIAKDYPFTALLLQKIVKDKVPLSGAFYLLMLKIYVKQNDPQGAVAIWQAARADRNITMTSALLTQGLFALCKTGRVEQAWDELTLPANDRCVDLHAINTVIFGSLRLGKEEIALQALKMIETRKLKPDLFSLGPFAQFYAASNNAAKATEYFTRMQELGIRPDASVLHAMVDMSTRMGEDAEALKYYRQALSDTELIAKLSSH